MKETKVEAKTIQDAVEIGLMELGLRRDQVEVVVVSEGTKGFLGLGAKKACVMLREKKWTGGGHYQQEDSRRERPSAGRGRNENSRRDGPPRRDRGNSRPRPERTPYARTTDAVRPDAVYQEVSLAMETVQTPEDPVEHAKLVFATTIKLMSLEATVTDAKQEPGQGIISLKFDCPDSAVFTAENARGLQSLQFLINSIINKNRKNRYSVRIDTAEYWTKKEEELAAKVESVVKDVIGTARPYRLEPMSAPLRKYVHSLIKAKYPEVETLSEGEGKWRKVVIRPASQKEAAQQ
ncbi:MAG: hypothetical protein A2270_10690 [Elusimicrobia bacterium RIFOXYA12_FULL_51_18]|nr:MAG: hypothetical protein A2270_10690 [Elusimicrobia bacterium RIFOXYA12_FULL_51_18]OGS29468.1 MAG: hypothetical protein A2218_00500 [Elusimicrobia bacterium RIFOXYA2_FULL_53_38]